MSGVHVDGLDQTMQALAQTAVDVTDLNAMSTVGDVAADAMRGFIPVRTGKARNTIRAGRAKNNSAEVTLGGPKAPHAFVIRHTHPSRFVEKTDQFMETRAVDILEGGLTDILTRNGLTS